MNLCQFWGTVSYIYARPRHKTYECCQNSSMSIGLISRRQRGNYLVDSMEAIPTFEGGKRQSALQEDFPLFSYKNRRAHCRLYAPSLPLTAQLQHST